MRSSISAHWKMLHQPQARLKAIYLKLIKSSCWKQRGRCAVRRQGYCKWLYEDLPWPVGTIEGEKVKEVDDELRSREY